LNAANSALLTNGEYFWQLTVVHPDTFSYRWYNGTLKAFDELYTGDTASSITTVIAVSGSNVTSTITLSGVSGSGDVVGPASATDGNIVLFDGTTGKLIKNSSVSPSSFDASGAAAAAQANAVQRANHTGTQVLSTISDVTTVGGNIAKLTNPSAIRTIRINADNTVAAVIASEFIGIACSDETTVLAAASTSVPVATFHAPYAMTLTRVFAGLRTAGTGAAVVTVDIHLNGTTIMSTTKILFTASQKLSADGTLTTTAIAAGDYVEIFLDVRDTNNVATGLKTYLVGHK
jgi:hypothetical protein